MKTLLLLCLVATVACTSLYSGYTFEKYVEEFKRNYATPSEKERRRAVFEANLNKIRAVNSNPKSSWFAAVNEFTDLTSEEFKSKYAGYNSAMRKSFKSSTAKSAPEPKKTIQDLPNAVDWREKNVVTDPKDQAGCGSCWAFSAVETIESFWALKTGNLIVMSEQNVLDCTANPRHCGGKGGCGGAIQELAYDAMVTKGITTEEAYPYESGSGSDFKCRFDPVKMPIVANVTGHVKNPSNKYQPLMEAVATKGPISVTVAASSWQSYGGGVHDCQDDWALDHGVQLVGYGTDDTLGDYWLVRNSWGGSWGESGYIRVKRTASEETKCGTDTTPNDGTACDGDPSTQHVCGTCGILFDTSYPTLA